MRSFTTVWVLQLRVVASIATTVNTVDVYFAIKNGHAVAWNAKRNEGPGVKPTMSGLQGVCSTALLGSTKACARPLC